MALLDELAPDPDVQRRRCDIAVKWGQVSFYSPSRDLVNALDTALRDAEELDDAQRLAKVTFWVGMFNYALGNHPAALADFQRCQEMSELVGPELFDLTINYLGRVHFYLSDFPRSIEYLQRGIALLDEVQRPAEAVNSMGLLVMNYGFIGAFDKVPALAKRIFRMASAVRNPTIESTGHVCTGLSDLMQGNWEKALDALDKARTVSLALGNPIMEGLATWGQGFALTMLDDSDAGVARMNEGIAMIRSTESHLGLSAYLGEQSVIYVQLGQWRTARDFANQTLEMSQEGEKLGDDLAYSTLGRVAMRRPRPDWTEAQAHMERSLRISREKGARTLLCRTLFFYAELLHEQGEDERARACLKEARELFVDVGMQWWLEQSEPLHAALDG
ncbi:MAG TPA: tetratricopeptide repeat protein [bacterium]|nr:tetratricopeptide repeat protein [bacterium]